MVRVTKQVGVEQEVATVYNGSIFLGFVDKDCDGWYIWWLDMYADTLEDAKKIIEFKG